METTTIKNRRNMFRVEIYARQKPGTDLHRGWCGSLYITSSELQPGMAEVTRFGNQVYVRGRKLEMPDKLRNEFLAEDLEEHIKILSAG